MGATTTGRGGGDRARHARRVLRAVLVFGVGAAALFVLWFVALATFAGARYGWIWTALAFSALGAGTAWLGVSGAWGRARRLVTIGLAALLAVLGLYTAHVAAPGPGRLREAIAGLQVPSAWHAVGDDVSGNGLCLDVCFTVTRSYTASPTDAAALVERTVRTLRAKGLTEMRGEGRARELTGRRGDAVLWVTIDSESVPMRMTIMADALQG